MCPQAVGHIIIIIIITIIRTCTDTIPAKGARGRGVGGQQYTVLRVEYALGSYSHASKTGEHVDQEQ